MKTLGKFIAFFVVALAGSLVGVWVYSQWVGASSATLNKEENLQQSYKAKYEVESVEIPYFDFADIAEMTLPTVVHIKTKSKKPEGGSPHGRSPFDFFFDQPRNMPDRGASGSGCILSRDGYIVTNNHVIEGADEVEVTLNDNSVIAAEIIGADPSTDLALLKVNQKDMPYLPFGNSDDLRIGEWVLALGNPFNLTGTVTAGIVSAKGRNINLLGGGTSIESFIQTDAAVNPGNSGGPLINKEGKLIGINTAIASRTGSYSGYSFAVPVAIVEKVVNDLKNYGEVQRGFIGINILNVTPELAKETGFERNEGVYVADLTPNGAAEEAGIKKGDIITHIDGAEMNNVARLQETIGRKNPGDEVSVKVWRKGKEKSIGVILRNQEGLALSGKNKFETVEEILGAQLSVLSEEEMKERDLTHGLKVEKLTNKTLKNAGVKEGFIILKIDKEPMYNMHDVYAAIHNADGGVLVECLNLEGKRQFFAIGLDS